MGVINRRNAVFGWAVWNVGKQVAKQKAKAVASDGSRRSKKGAAAAALATAGGAVWFWRRRRGESDED